MMRDRISILNLKIKEKHWQNFKLKRSSNNDNNFKMRIDNHKHQCNTNRRIIKNMKSSNNKILKIRAQNLLADQPIYSKIQDLTLNKFRDLIRITAKKD